MTNMDSPPLPSNRKFGWFFTAVFALLTIFLGWNGITSWALITSVVAVSFATASTLCPDRLVRLNKA